MSTLATVNLALGISIAWAVAGLAIGYGIWAARQAWRVAHDATPLLVGLPPIALGIWIIWVLISLW